jgi:hypothetical protein
MGFTSFRLEPYRQEAARFGARFVSSFAPVLEAGLSRKPLRIKGMHRSCERAGSSENATVF